MENVHLIYESMGIRISYLMAGAYISERGQAMEKENLMEYLRRKMGITFVSSMEFVVFFLYQTCIDQNGIE